jgi:hypothetical protein
MMSRRTVAVVVLVGMGSLQLWDSRVFSAGGPVIAIAVTALLLPIGTLVFTERLDLRFGSVVACALLLLSAKVVAPHPLPALGVAAVIAGAANWLAVSKRTPC